MAAINFQPETELAPSDPSNLPCLFVGKLEHIRAAGYSGVSKFLGDKVDEKVILVATSRDVFIVTRILSFMDNIVKCSLNACMLMFLCTLIIMMLHNNALYGVLLIDLGGWIGQLIICRLV